MASLNKVMLIGNLTRDPELRYIPSGTAVATFTLAVNRVYKMQTGEKKEQASFIRIVVWGRVAEVCGEYLSKGSPVFVEGRLQSRDWETQDGQKRSTTEVVADNIQFLRMGPKAGGPGGSKPPMNHHRKAETSSGFKSEAQGMPILAQSSRCVMPVPANRSATAGLAQAIISAAPARAVSWRQAVLTSGISDRGPTQSSQCAEPPRRSMTATPAQVRDQRRCSAKKR